MNILVTGCAGFIGFHVIKRLIKEKKHKIIGIDNLDSNYDIKLKKNRLKNINSKNFLFFKLNFNKTNDLKKINKYNFDVILHFGARAGVRNSMRNPGIYTDSNIIGFCNIIEFAKQKKVKNFIFASSSSIYGDQKKIPFKEKYKDNNALSYYAATKQVNEIIAKSYSNMYNINITALRFFTVYGPFGRPDMAVFKFIDAIYKNQSIKLFNKGKCYRDFSYIDDVVEGIIKVINRKKASNYNVYNLGNEKKYSTKELVNIIFKITNKKTKVINVKKNFGDMDITISDSTLFKKNYKFKFKTSLENGIKKTIEWYKNNYKVDDF